MSDNMSATTDADPLVEAMRGVIEALDADMFVYSGNIDFKGSDRFVDTLESTKRRKNAVLILATPGGIADAAYIIARHLKRTYERFILFICGYCKSAGTLIAIGADEIVMFVRGELGPLDVQLLKSDEIGMRTSGLSASQALDFISDQAFNIFEQSFLAIKQRSAGAITTKTAGDIAAQLALGLLAPITSQIDPLRLGEIQRSIDIAFQYGQRLNPNHNIAARLIGEYPSHSFIIDYEEAKEIFGNSVRKPTNQEVVLEDQLCRELRRQTGTECVRFPNENETVIIALHSVLGGDNNDQSETSSQDDEIAEEASDHQDELHDSTQSEADDFATVPRQPEESETREDLRPNGKAR
jgi:hypothetical protein